MGASMKGGIAAGVVGALAATGIALQGASGVAGINRTIGTVDCERAEGRRIASVQKIGALDFEGEELLYRFRRFAAATFEATAEEGWETVVARMPVAEVDLSLGATAMTLGSCRALALSCQARDCVTVDVTGPRSYRSYASRLEIFLSSDADEGEAREALMTFVRSQRK
ncbi:MAG: hypothetical protein H6923_02690 [Alphaproteobacteria bacterium]|nr:hypothetical protein [Alphaproteobacteria bacterium]